MVSIKKGIRLHRKKKLMPFTVTDFIIAVILLFFAVLIIFPFYGALMQSIVPQAIFKRSGFILIPPQVTLENYKYVLNAGVIWNSMFVSTLVTVIGTVYCMLLITIGAYAWNFKYPGYKLVKFLMIFTMFFSGGLIPYYLLMSAMGLKNSIWVMILPMGVPLFYLIIVADSFKGLPPSLMDAARVDGANDFFIFAKIVLPMSLPILATITLYNAVDRWNEWYHAMLFITNYKVFPLQLVLRNVIMSASFIATDQRMGMQPFLTGQIFADGLRMATIIVTMVPVLIIYPFLQKYFLKGITLGAVKE